MKAAIVLFLGLTSQIMLCFALISLLDGGTFTLESNTNLGLARVESTVQYSEKPMGCGRPNILTLLKRESYGQCPLLSKPTKGQGSAPTNNVARAPTNSIAREPTNGVARDPTNSIAREPINEKRWVEEVSAQSDDVIQEVEEPATPPLVAGTQKPYIVKAIPKPHQEPDLVSLVGLKTRDGGGLGPQVPAPAINSSSQDKEIQTNSVPLEDLGVRESAVEEEMLDPSTKVDDIISFSRWAEKQTDTPPVKETEKKNDQPKAVFKPNGMKAANVKLTKNFASPDCTAKITGANPESQGSGNVITSSRDEYLLNKCSDRAYFVVELCESIKALKVQLANFELYSSSPKEFRVSIGNAFPSREKDWVEFGTFTYEDERSVQSFKNEEGVLGKFAKVEILSHHGTEHYCPISMFRVYGIPEIDLISGDEVNDDDDGDDEPSSGTTDEKEGNDNPIVKSVKSIGDVFVQMIRNIVFKTPQNTSITVSMNATSLFGSSMRHVLKTRTTEISQDRLYILTYLLSTQYSTIRRYLYTMSVRNVLLHNCCDYGFSLPSTSGNMKQSWRWLGFLKVVHGDDFILALCNVLSIELGLSDLAGEFSTSNRTDSVPVNSSLGGTPQNISSIHLNKSNIELPLKPVLSDQGLAAVSKNTSSVVREDSLRKDLVEERGEDANINGDLKDKGGGRETTWQKLANRIRSLERNVSLSTGFLEELSLKYIKQIDELNTAVKVMSESISSLTKKEEACKVKGLTLEKQVESLTVSFGNLETRLAESREEMMSRHGLLVLLEVCLLGLFIFWCSPSAKPRDRTSISAAAGRRLSLDTLKSERSDKNKEKEKDLKQRRKSIEVGSLANGHVGSMIELLGQLNPLSRNQRRKRRRKEGRSTTDNLKNVAEESEDDVYSTFHGGQELVKLNLDRKRSSSLSDRRKISSSLSDKRKISSSYVERGESSSCSESDYENKKKGLLPGSREEPQSNLGDVTRSNLWANHVNDVIKSTRFLVSQVASEVDRQDESSRHYTKTRPASRSKDRVDKYESPEVVVDNIKLTNFFGVLDNSVHDVDSETDTETRDNRLVNGRGLSSKKLQRSKSTSPNRHANMLKKQKVFFKNFRPENADWLHRPEEADWLQ